MLENIGTPEILIIALLLLVFFGGKRLPEFFKSFTEAVREYKKAVKDDDEDN